MNKLYKLLKDGEIFFTETPGKFAGHKGYKIFGTLECKSGKRMKKENRVFFENLKDSIDEGYRPCKNCKPVNQDMFDEVKPLLPYDNLTDWYDSGKHFRKKLNK